MTPVAAGPDAATSAPTPQQMLALLQRATAETALLHQRLHALTVELQSAQARLAEHFGDGPKLTAVTGPDLLDPATPAMSVAVEMAVAGFTRAEAHARLTEAFAIAHPDAILDEVFGAA